MPGKLGMRYHFNAVDFWPVWVGSSPRKIAWETMNRINRDTVPSCFEVYELADVEGTDGDRRCARHVTENFCSTLILLEPLPEEDTIFVSEEGEYESIDAEFVSGLTFSRLAERYLGDGADQVYKFGSVELKGADVFRAFFHCRRLVTSRKVSEFLVSKNGSMVRAVPVYSVPKGQMPLTLPRRFFLDSANDAERLIAISKEHTKV